ncbi:chalcone isomerase family protein [Ferrimonas sp. YFM]|uniref:chalcone isomerase family protein n=1 Tax=Ferrimonas sp. YFM TaxID=3028878 RepID=UPI0025732777|nr:chalcone isomerase family protein [Ferrimonas sp. YFM]BDY03692.1 membrane protein [Ferrimonas sp. YFM]
MKALAVCITSLMLCGPAAATLPLVGESKLRVLFWDIYTARLYAPQGQFTGISPPLTLSLTYHRSIDSADLVKATKEQWQRLDYQDPDSQAWLEQVASCFPDVSDGDNLSFTLAPNNRAEIEFNGELRCALPPSKGNSQFLAIWLSEQSAYPRLTNRLIAKGE